MSESNQKSFEQREALARLKRDVVRVAQAEQSAYQRAEQAEREAERWRRRARLALEHGDEELARQALARAARFADEAAQARADFAELAGHVGALKQELRTLERGAAPVWQLGTPAWLARDPVEERFDRLERERAREEIDRQLQELKADIARRNQPGFGT